MSGRRKIVLAAVFIALFLSGCVAKYIKVRLRPPHPVEDISKYRDIIDTTFAPAGENVKYILFQYENKAAHYVNLAGDFNGWCGTKDYHRFDPSIGVMHDDDGDGIWEIVVPLPPGRYQYKFVIDHGASWVQDPNNPLRDYEDGIENSLLIVEE